MEHLKLFHRDVLTVRSHQWKYYVEPYSGCALQCTYCLYWEAPEYREHLYPPAGLLEGLERDLARMVKRQIIYIGATIDPYQMLEKKLCSTRQVLERVARRGLPVVLLTKSPLIMRDRDLLLDLSRRGLVLVQFTVLNTNSVKSRAIERGAPSVAERLRAAAELSAAGVPVHFHLSPVIPGFYADSELDATVRAIADHGGQCIYSNILGMRNLNREVWFNSVAPLGLPDTEPAYGRTGDPGKNVYSPHVELIHDEMSRLAEICRKNRIDFICEFIPGLNVFDPARFERGIFRFGLPAVYQMVRMFEGCPKRVRWADFQEELQRRFAAVDDEYLALVKQLWDSGELFDNTAVAADVVNGSRTYYWSGELQLARNSVLAWD